MKSLSSYSTVLYTSRQRPRRRNEIIILCKVKHTITRETEAERVGRIYCLTVE